MKYCIVCRQAFLEPDFFCPTHGLRLRIAEADHVKQCLGCGSIIERGEIFCRRCGFDVTDTDWSEGAGELEPGNATEPGAETRRARVREAAAVEDDGLRLRPFRRAKPRSQHGRRVRRHSRIGILLVAIIISVSVVAWHAFDLDRWRIVERLHVLPFGSTAPASQQESNPRNATPNETSLTETQSTARMPDQDQASGFTEEMKPQNPYSHSPSSEPELSRGKMMEKSPSVSVVEPPISDTRQLGEPSEPSKFETPSSNRNRPVKKSSEAANTRSPTQAARARSPSPEEIQREREAERKRVQKAIEEAIANRGVSGVAVAFINGTVFLTGEVQTVNQREAAEQAARRLPNVKDVRSRISVKWAAESQG